MLKRIVLASLLVCGLGAAPSFAQTTVGLCYWGLVNGVNKCTQVSPTHPLPITGSFSATVSGFEQSTVSGIGTPISVTTGGVTGTIPAGTSPTATEVIATNVGTTNGAYCQTGGSATTSSQYIAPNGGWFAFALNGETQLTCITSTSTTTVNMVAGAGLPTGTGGGGGGSGGAVTIASGGVASGAYASGSIASGAAVSGSFVDGAITTLGTEADAAWTSGSGTAIALLKNIAGGIAASVPAGSAYIGHTSQDPCSYQTKKSVAFSTGSDGALLAAGTSSTNTYICSLSVIASAAANFGIGVGSGSSVCTSGTPLALIGSTTASSGLALAANGGLTLGNGTGTIANDVGAAAQGYNVCIRINGTANLAGNLTYVQQ